MSIAKGLHRLFRSRTIRFGSLALALGLALLDGWYNWASSSTQATPVMMKSQPASAHLSMQQLYDRLVAGDAQPVHDLIAKLRAELPEDRTDWNYGNVAHKLMILIGLQTLVEENDVAGAKDWLIMASQMSGSPQLNSFGPNMLLAKALLERGEFEAVDLYLDHCKSFWVTGITQLDAWKCEVRDHRIPDFGANIEY